MKPGDTEWVHEVEFGSTLMILSSAQLTLQHNKEEHADGFIQS